MIYFDSRYVDGEIRKAHDARSDRYRLTVYREWPRVTSGFFYYEWADGDRLDYVAAKVYGNGQLWWKILDANPELVDPLSIKPGEVLRVPNG